MKVYRVKVYVNSYNIKAETGEEAIKFAEERIVNSLESGLSILDIFNVECEEVSK